MTERRAALFAGIAFALAIATNILAESADAPLTPARIDALINAGDFAEAERLARQLVAQDEKRHGAESLEAAAAAQQLMHALFYLGRVTEPETLRLAERVVATRRRVLGADDPQVADGLNDLGLLESALGRPLDARPRLEEALAIQRRVLPADSPDIATSLNNLGSVLVDAGDLRAARQAFSEALEILRRIPDADPDNVSYTTRNLAGVMSDAGDPGAAEPLFREACAELRTRLGDQHPELATCLNGLGLALHRGWQLEEARSVLEESLAIRRAALGPDHPYVATSLNNLALVRLDAGDVVGAREMLEQALDIDRRALGAEHPATASALANLADLTFEQGDTAAARPLMEQALAIEEAALGQDHPSVATTLHALGSRLRDAGELDAAQLYLERALEIRRKVLGAQSQEIVPTLNNLGMLLAARGDHAAARAMFEEGLAILDRAPPGPRADRAALTLNLGRLSAQDGDLSMGLARSEEAVAIFRAGLGPDHWMLAEALAVAGTMRAATGDSRGAMDAAVESERISRDLARVTAASLSQREALRYASTHAGGLDVALSIASATRDADMTSRAWTQLMRSRALVAEVMTERTSLARIEPGLEDLARARTTAARRLAQLVARGPGASAESDQVAVAAARAGLESAERELGRRSAGFRLQRAGQEVDLAEIGKALRDDEALVAYARFSRWSVAAPGQPRPTRLVSEPWYAALVLPSREAAPRIVPLAPAETVDRLVAAWRQVASDPGAEFRSAGQALRVAAWDPVSAVLGDARRVRLVPDAALLGVSFAALPDASGRFLVETGPLIECLSVERDLVRAAPPMAQAGFGMLAMGNPAFDEAPWIAAPRPALRRALDVASSTIATLLPRGDTSTCGGFTGLKFGPLPDSARELEDLAQAWRALADGAGQSRRVTELSGRDASEEAFDRLAPAHRFVHVATHGFFVAGDCRASRSSIPDMGESSPPALAESPMLRSGLALAGFNRRGEAPPGSTDGVLTAEEVASLDLSGVEWVVLSACDTGLGDVAAGEGVLGLQRAFRIAGARNLLFSLWSVPDRATREWMAALYDARLRRGLGAAESAREASLSVLRRRRARDLPDHPYYWGAFVATGDAR